MKGVEISRYEQSTLFFHFPAREFPGCVLQFEDLLITKVEINTRGVFFSVFFFFLEKSVLHFDVPSRN